jgi:methionyl aminopeptidase
MGIVIKNEKQIAGIRKSCTLAADTLVFAGQEVKEGVTTEFLNSTVDEYIRDHHAVPAPLNYHGFPKSVCTSLNEVICHGIPNEQTVLKEGDIINIDVTAILDGYYGDTSTMFVVGEISEVSKKLLKATKHCLALGVSQVAPGVAFGIIGVAITQYAQAQGYSVVHQFCGHGTGLQFHEEPQINHYCDGKVFDRKRMKPGMIFTIEPMINEGVSEAVINKKDRWTATTKDGKLSAQYEHTVLVTETGVEVLTLPGQKCT